MVIVRLGELRGVLRLEQPHRQNGTVKATHCRQRCCASLLGNDPGDTGSSSSYSVSLVSDGASLQVYEWATSWHVPGRGLRLQRTVLASRGGAELYVDRLKSNRARTVPLIAELVPIIDRWATDKASEDWLLRLPKEACFANPIGSGPLTGSRLVRRLAFRRSECTIFDTPQPQSGLEKVLTPRWFSGSWDTPRPP
jgi:hypothetical protein